MKELTTDGIAFTNITITGIPDGVSPLANDALVEKGSLRRLYIFSDTPLNEKYMHSVDQFYGRDHYAITVGAMANTVVESIPNTNFYMSAGPPSSVTDFVEYRYMAQRHLLTNVYVDSSTNELYKLVLPERPLLVIIMPSNFIRTGMKTGYFRYASNLIIRVYSKYILSSTLFEEDTNEVTKFNSYNSQLKSMAELQLSRCGMHKIVSSRNDQIYGYDKYMTMVVGSISNLVL